MKVLIVEDDELLQQGLYEALWQEGYACDQAYSTEQAQLYFSSTQYSCVLLDLGLPGGSGLDLLTKWRKSENKTPVIIITARDSIDDRVLGLDAGADDYMIKPFELKELFARLRAAIRRAMGQADNSIVYDDFVLDLSNRQLCKGEALIELTPREFAILSRLMLKPHQVVGRETLQQDMYSWEDSFGSNTLEVYIHRLRSKLGKEYIHTVRGSGYRFEKK